MSGAGKSTNELNARIAELQHSLQLAGVDQFTRQMIAANENIKGAGSGFRSTGVDALAMANHLKTAAVALYAFSPAFRQLANPAIAASLKAVGPAAVAAGGAAVSALSPVLAFASRIALPIYAGVKAFEAMNAITALGATKLKELTDLTERAGGAGVSSDFWQRNIKGAEDLAVKADSAATALERFSRISEPSLGGSSFDQRLAELQKWGNFANNAGVIAYKQAVTVEEKYRAASEIVSRAIEQGERLAGLDLASKFLPPDMMEKLRANGELLRDLQQAADDVKPVDLVSQNDIGYAAELKRRLDEAHTTIEKGLLPLQRDLTQLGLSYQETWVRITELQAWGVTKLNEFYGVLKDIKSYFELIGNLPVWTKIGNYLSSKLPAWMSSTPELMGIAPAGTPGFAPTTGAGSAANSNLKGWLGDASAVQNAMKNMNALQSKVLSDLSKGPPAAAKQFDQVNDAVDRAINALNKHIEQQKADTAAVGLGAAAQAVFRAEAARTTAVQANGGKITDQQAAAFARMRDEAGRTAEALERARVASKIDFDRKTAFLSADDAQIAQQLTGIYGNNIPAALASSEAAAIRFNNQLKSINEIGRQSVQSFATDLVAGLRNGETAMAAIGHAAQNLSAQLTNSAITELLKGNLIGAAASGLGAIVSGIFGNNQKKKDEQAAAAKAAAERSESYAQRALLANIDTATQAGELQAFDIQAQKQRLDEQRAGGRAMAQLEQALAAERLAITDKWAKQALEIEAAKAKAEQEAYEASLKRIQDYRDRVFAAANDNSTLDGALAEFNRAAMREQADEIAAGGQAINDLIAAQEAERLGIYRKFNDAAIAAAKAASDELTKIYKSIKDYLQGLKTGASSILSPQAQLQAASQNFTSSLALAQGGDRDAINGLTQVSQTYLDQAKSFYASSQGYADIYNQVTTALSALAANMPTMLSDGDRIVAAVNDNTQAVNITGAQADALSAAQNALAAQQVTYLQTQTNLLDAIRGLNATAASQLVELKNLNTAQTTVAVSGLSGGAIANNTIISALNKIAVNTAYQFKSGGDALYQVGSFEKGGVIPGYEDGGMVGNGIFGRDSVLARYAGGGAIALAGGEYVMPAAETRRFMPILDAMRSGSIAPASSNDNGSREIGMAINRQTEILASRFDAMAAELAELRADNKSLNIKLSMILAAA